MNPGKVVFISGASSGIGEATARYLASKGFRVVLGARRFERLQSIAQAIQEAGGSALPIDLDVSNLVSITAGINKTIEMFGSVDILVNNAGFGRLNWLENLKPEVDIRQQLEVNLLGVIYLTQAVLPYMIQQGSGHIINIASMASFLATPTYTIYAASKFGERGFNDALRREVKIWGINVSAIYPGPVNTEFKQHTGAYRRTGTTTPSRLRLEPIDVARKVGQVINKPRRMTVIPRIMWLAVWVNAIFPGLVDWFSTEGFVRRERQ